MTSRCCETSFGNRHSRDAPGQECGKSTRQRHHGKRHSIGDMFADAAFRHDHQQHLVPGPLPASAGHISGQAAGSNSTTLMPRRMRVYAGDHRGSRWSVASQIVKPMDSRVSATHATCRISKAEKPIRLGSTASTNRPAPTPRQAHVPARTTEKTEVLSDSAKTARSVEHMMGLIGNMASPRRSGR